MSLIHNNSIQDFEKALELAQQAEFIALVHYNWARTLEEIGRISQAIERYKQAVEVDPLLTTAYRSLIQLLEERGEQESAAAYREQLEEIIQTLIADLIDGQPDAGTATRLIGLGDDLRAQNQHDEAIQFYDAAIALNPNLIAAYNNKAKSLEALNRFEEALTAYQSAIDTIRRTNRERLNQSEADALSTTYSNLGDLYLRLREPQLAEDA